MRAYLATQVLAVEEAGHTPNPLLPATAEIIVGLVAFAILYFFLAKKVFPIFERVYRERAEAIEGGMSRASTAQAEAESLLQQYRAQLQEARTEASRIRTDAQAERAGIVEAARVEAREAAQQEVARASQRIEVEIATARAELSRDVGRLAVDLAGQIVGENLADTKATSRTVDRFLAGLDELAPAGAVEARPTSPVAD